MRASLSRPDSCHQSSTTSAPSGLFVLAHQQVVPPRRGFPCDGAARIAAPVSCAGDGRRRRSDAGARARWRRCPRAAARRATRAWDTRAAAHPARHRPRRAPARVAASWRCATRSRSSQPRRCVGSAQRRLSRAVDERQHAASRPRIPRAVRGARVRDRRARAAVLRASAPAGTGSASIAPTCSPVSCRCAASRLVLAAPASSSPSMQRRVVVVVERTQPHRQQQQGEEQAEAASAARRRGDGRSDTGNVSGCRGRAHARMRALQSLAQCPRRRRHRQSTGTACRIAFASAACLPASASTTSRCAATGVEQRLHVVRQRRGRDRAATHTRARRAAARCPRAATGRRARPDAGGCASSAPARNRSARRWRARSATARAQREHIARAEQRRAPARSGRDDRRRPAARVRRPRRDNRACRRSRKRSSCESGNG